jgi:heme/copper-type cytochrome/quinol oxidase subunit 4
MARLSVPARVWFFLLGATLANYLLMEWGAFGQDVSSRLIGAAILLLAFVKVRLVIRHFMEVAEAPKELGYIMDTWIVIVCASLLAQRLWLT